MLHSLPIIVFGFSGRLLVKGPGFNPMSQCSVRFSRASSGKQRHLVCGSLRISGWRGFSGELFTVVYPKPQTGDNGLAGVTVRVLVSPFSTMLFIGSEDLQAQFRLRLWQHASSLRQQTPSQTSRQSLVSRGPYCPALQTLNPNPETQNPANPKP